jgi:allantoate deiminase
VAAAIRNFGNDPGAIPEAEIPVGAAFGYLEAHIEQGPVLESMGAPLGVVSAITSQSRLTLTFGGRSGHAGTTPMGTRQDALGGAAAFVLLAEAQALATPGLVATVGQIAAQPGSANVIPGEVTLSLDVRHPDGDARRAALGRLLAAGAAEAERRRLTVQATEVFAHPAVPCDAALSALLGEAVRGVGLPAPELVSGAGHDAQILAARWPVAMLFLRSPGGISHHPDETVLPGDVALAVQTIVAFLERLGRRRTGEAPGGDGGRV